jgi:hypothetical protein
MVRVSVDYGTCKASGNSKEYPSQKMMYPIQALTDEHLLLGMRIV